MLLDVLNNGWNYNDPGINEDKLELKSSVLTLKPNKHCTFCFPPIFPTRYRSTIKIKSLFWGVPISESGFYSPSSEDLEPEPKNRHRGRAQRQKTGRLARNLESLWPGISIRGKEEGGWGGDKEYMGREDGGWRDELLLSRKIHFFPPGWYITGRNTL